jgi:thiamine transporter ThiT
MKFTIKKICLIGLFISAGVSLGFALAQIPNVELITATIFLSGYFLGLKEGILVGVLTEGIYSLLSPFGLAAPPLFLAQLISMGFAGFAGALFRKHQSANEIVYTIQLGVVGFGVTLLFAVLTTLSFVLFIELSARQLIGSFIYGMGFYITHLITNTLIFMLVVPIIIKGLDKIKTPLFE